MRMIRYWTEDLTSTNEVWVYGAIQTLRDPNIVGKDTPALYGSVCFEVLNNGAAVGDDMESMGLQVLFDPDGTWRTLLSGSSVDAAADWTKYILFTDAGSTIPLLRGDQAFRWIRLPPCCQFRFKIQAALGKTTTVKINAALAEV